MRINTNISALNAYRQLGMNQAAISKNIERLSSGFRINRAGDDAAGLATSEKMRAQIRGLTQASRNAQDGISLIQTAEGALNETHSILQRMRELAVQSATDTNTFTDRKEIQKEINQLLSEIDRIADQTEFNTQKLLNGSYSQKLLHIGANEGQNMLVGISNMSTGAIGTQAGVDPTRGGAEIGGFALTVQAGEGGEHYNEVNLVFALGTTAGAAWDLETTTVTVTLEVGEEYSVEDVNEMLQTLAAEATESVPVPGLSVSSLNREPQVASMWVRLGEIKLAGGADAVAADPGVAGVEAGGVQTLALTTGISSGAAGAAAAGGNEITVTTGAVSSQAAVAAEGSTEVDGATITITGPVASGAAAYNGIKFTFATGSSSEVGAEFSAGSSTVTVTLDENASYDAAAIEGFIQALSTQGELDFSGFTVAADSGFSGADGSVWASAVDAVLAGGSDYVAGDPGTAENYNITITAPEGAAYNDIEITFAAVSTGDAGAAVNSSGLITVTLLNDGSYDAEDIAGFIQGLGTNYAGFTVAASSGFNGASGIEWAGVDNITLAGGLDSVPASSGTTTEYNITISGPASSAYNGISIDFATGSAGLVGAVFSAGGNTVTVTLQEGESYDAAAVEGLIQALGAQGELDFSEFSVAAPTAFVGATGAQWATISFALANGQSEVEGTEAQAALVASAEANVEGVALSVTGGTGDAYAGLAIAFEGGAEEAGAVWSEVNGVNTLTLSLVDNENYNTEMLNSLIRSTREGTPNGVELGRINLDLGLEGGLSGAELNGLQVVLQAPPGGPRGIAALRVDNVDAVTTGTGASGVLSQAGADSAITNINNAIEQVSSERSKLGAVQNRLEHTIANLGTSAENLQAAESRIRDLDMAQEIMAFTKNTILQQAATAMLAQANMAPQSVLQLLG